MSLPYMQTVDWNNVVEASQWNTGEVRVTYEMPLDITEEQLRQNILFWDYSNIWTLFKLYRISPDLMRQMQSNLSKKDIKTLEHEIYIDCIMVRQCFVEQIANYLTYMQQCRVYFEDDLKDEFNQLKLLNRLRRMMCSLTVHRNIASFIDYDGKVLDEVTYGN